MEEAFLFRASLLRCLSKVCCRAFGKPEMQTAYKVVKSSITPTLELAGGTQLPENTNCLACSEDGRYLGLGHSKGLSVWCASTFICVAEWLQNNLEITLIRMTRMAEITYLLGTIDDMGVARVFAHHSDRIHLLSVINIMDDINKRSICLTFDLHEGGHFGAASISCSGDVCLDVYQFPLAEWLKELEILTSQKQDSNLTGDLGVQWSPVTVMIKITPPKIPAGKALDGPLGVLQTRDFLTHWLALDAFRSRIHQREKSSFCTNPGNTLQALETLRRCTHHFLLPCGQLPDESKANFQPGMPVAITVWWAGSQNLLQYFLQNAPKNKQGRTHISSFLNDLHHHNCALKICCLFLFHDTVPLHYMRKVQYSNISIEFFTFLFFEADVVPMPDVVLPNAKEIVCSAVSRCTRYIALGLDDALVCVWDRRSESPLSVTLMPAENSPLFRMQFVDYWPLPAADSQILTTEMVYLFVLCKSGASYTVTTGHGTLPCVMQVIERPKDHRDLPAFTISVPFLQGMSLVVQTNGKMFLQDIINKVTVCFLTPPTSHQITSPYNPVYVMNTKQQVLFIRGDQEPSSNAFSKESSQLFVFPFRHSDILKQYVVSHPDLPQQQKNQGNINLDETFNFYFQQRVLSVKEREKSMAQSWEKLQEIATVVKQRQQVRSQERCTK
ncbi:WD repeat-containing protein 93 isoform X2 [Melanotaenia boesemani]|uniref:WD repeat-containing protein 93 isoform X2 n=1 Tax=Melanotaenia boesemani TaxID=1250792 RepID=UPI001C049B97|nr:WD repeat-containing protein 93 isoform X2 [Melanotaenia boesemani]